MKICILGRQGKLGIAELEQRYGSLNVKPIHDRYALVDAEVSIDTIGGSVKVAMVLDTLDTTNPQKVFDLVRRKMKTYVADIPDGKIQLGVSLYDLDMPVAKVNANVLSLKKVVKQSGRSVRAVPNTDTSLSSAQTYHNHLTGQTGLELVFVKHGSKTLVGQVYGVQNIDAYAARDQARPKTDAFVGMLPPKLAQMMLNMSGVQSGRVLDPFCGTGVVLQEAALLGFDVYGTDLSEKMIDYSKINLAWLKETYGLNINVSIDHGDAIETSWQPPIDAVVAETYLGQPFSAPPAPDKLLQVKRICNEIISRFLLNIHDQIGEATNICLAVPAWRSENGYETHLPLINELQKLGYERVELKHVRSADLLYYREDQVVARELLLLKKV